MEIASRSYYIYALKDSRKNPAQIFYIGKGTGSRKDDHLKMPDSTPKGVFISEIIDSGGSVSVITLSDGLTEMQAIKLEAELIAAFGTEKNGGILKNSVSPTGVKNTKQENLNLPYGVYDRAQIGLNFIKEATLEFLKSNPLGVKNNQISRYLGLQSDNNGSQKDYLTYSILGILMKENLIYKTDNSIYKIKE